MVTRANLFDMPLDLVTMDEAVACCESLILSGKHSQQASMNASKVVLASRDSALRRSMQGSDVVTADGQSVVWAGRLLGLKVPERVAGIDLMEHLLALAERRGYPVFFLGAESAVLAQFAGVVCGRYPHLTIAGYRDGYFDNEPAIADQIHRSGARILFIGMPSPAKELFVDQNRAILGEQLCVGVGGSFDVWAGVTSRAPLWMQRVGLEWFYRLVQEPRKMWRRYLLGNLRFVQLTLGELVRRRRSHRFDLR